MGINQQVSQPTHSNLDFDIRGPATYSAYSYRVHTYVKMYVFARDSRLVEKGSLVEFLGPPTHRDLCTRLDSYGSPQDNVFIVHIRAFNSLKLRGRHYRAEAFPYCFYLAPLTSHGGLSRLFR
jgi:hypothetical protein